MSPTGRREKAVRFHTASGTTSATTSAVVPTATISEFSSGRENRLPGAGTAT